MYKVAGNQLHGTPLDPRLFWLDNIFKLAFYFVVRII
jgi:hypothetical protein